MLKQKIKILDQRGVAPVLELILAVVVIGALGFVGWRYYQTRQTKEASLTSTTTPAEKPKSDEILIEEALGEGKDCSDGAGEKVAGEPKIYKGFATAGVGCSKAAGGYQAILKKIDGKWQEISGTQNCLDSEVRDKYGMTDEVKDYLFPHNPPISYCDETLQ